MSGQGGWRPRPLDSTGPVPELMAFVLMMLVVSPPGRFLDVLHYLRVR